MLFLKSKRDLEKIANNLHLNEKCDRISLMYPIFNMKKIISWVTATIFSIVYILWAFPIYSDSKEPDNQTTGIIDADLKIAPDVRDLKDIENTSAFPWITWSDQKLTQDSILFQKIGKLSWIFYQYGSKKPWIFTQQDGVKIKISTGNYIFSHYDPLTFIGIESNDITIKNITNGNLYVESSGWVYTVFALDSVSEVTFLHQGKAINSYTLFPWMWISINAANIGELEWKDSLYISSIYPVHYIDTNTTWLINKHIPNSYRMILVLKKYLQSIAYNNNYFKYSVNNGVVDETYEKFWLINQSKVVYILTNNLLSNLRWIPGYTDEDINKLVTKIKEIYQIAEQNGVQAQIHKVFINFIEQTRFSIYHKEYQKKYSLVYNLILWYLNPKWESNKSFIGFQQALSDQYMNELLNEIDVKEEKPALIGDIVSGWSEDVKNLDIAIYIYSVLESYNIFNYEGTPIEFNGVFVLANNLFSILSRHFNTLRTLSEQEKWLLTIFEKFISPTTQSFLMGIKNAYFQDETQILLLKDEFVDDAKNAKINTQTLANIRELERIIGVFLKWTESIATSSMSDTLKLHYETLKNQDAELKKIIALLSDYQNYYFCEILGTWCKWEILDSTGNTNSWSTWTPIETISYSRDNLVKYLWQFNHVDTNTIQIMNNSPEIDGYYEVQVTIKWLPFQFRLTEEWHILSHTQYTKTDGNTDTSFIDMEIPLDEKEREFKDNKLSFNDFFGLIFFPQINPEVGWEDVTPIETTPEIDIDPEIVIFTNNLINEDFKKISDFIKIWFNQITVKKDNATNEYTIDLNNITKDYIYESSVSKKLNQVFKATFSGKYIYKRGFRAFNGLELKIKNTTKNTTFPSVCSIIPSTIMLDEVTTKLEPLAQYIIKLMEQWIKTKPAQCSFDLENWQVIVDDSITTIDVQ